MDKLITGGKTRTEAIRLLRRRLADAVYTTLRTDQRHHRPNTSLAAPIHRAA